ncbi:MAG: pilus assembly protein TadG-related protein [Gaiellales bacterium]
MSRRHHYCGESGQTLVAFVVFLIVSLSFMAIVIDGGMYLFERRQMQGTADAAALAAVRDLPNSVSSAHATAVGYVRNYNASAKGDLRSIAFSDANRSVTIQAGKKGTTSFSGLLGVDKPEIGARATARVQMMGPRPGMLPLAFMRDTFTIGENYEVKFDDNGYGNRGAIAPNMLPTCSPARGANDFERLIMGEEHGGIDACPTAIAETLDTEPGNMAGKTRSGFDNRLDGDGDSYSDVFGVDPATGLATIEKPNSSRIGIVPVIEHIDGRNSWPNGRSQPVRILAYMLVYIGKEGEPGNPAWTNNGKSVWVTPIRPILPADWVDGEFVDYDANLPAPVVYRLVD